MNIAPGTRLGRYEIRSKLGEGKSQLIARFDWSRDGKQILLGRGPVIDDVVLIKDFR
jgi:hypothetical protein